MKFLELSQTVSTAGGWGGGGGRRDSAYDRGGDARRLA